MWVLMIHQDHYSLSLVSSRYKGIVYCYNYVELETDEDVEKALDCHKKSMGHR